MPPECYHRNVSFFPYFIFIDISPCRRCSPTQNDRYVCSFLLRDSRFLVCNCYTSFWTVQTFDIEMMAPLTFFSISTGRLLHYITTITWREQHFYSTLCPSVLGICQWVTQLLLFSKHNICLWSGTNIYIFLKQMISISCNITDTVIVFCFCLLLFSFSFEGLTHPQLNMINFSNLLKCGWASHPIHGMTIVPKR